MADIQGTNGDDVIKGERGDDFIDGLDGNDRITDVWGNNTINGGAGNDRILASRGVDVVDGGSGSDRIWTRHGDDTATYRLSENLGAEDYYDGGHGTDTLRLVLTAEEAQDPAIQATIEALRSFIEDDPDPNNSGQQPTTFTFSKDGADADLTLRNFENLEIVIDDDELPSLSIDDPEVTEGDPGDNTTITFTVTRSGDNGAESTVDYAVLPGSATTPGDYGPPDPLTGTLTFAAGETEKTVTLDITEDDIPEQTESFTVELSAPTNAAITKAIGTGTILDDDQPGLSINDPEVTEGDPGDNTTITFTVTRSGDNGAESTVAYSVLPGTAGTPGDYGPPDPLTGTLTFAAGETEKTVTLDITEDDIPEQTESFTVELSAPTNAAITKAIGTGTILDDDQPGLSINDPEVTEGDPGDNTTITFTVTRSGDNGAESTVAYSVLPGTAGTPGDYGPPDPLTGTLTFAAGETEKTVTLDITEDDIPEQTESFTVELSAPTNAAITKAIGTGTILDDDQPGLSINDPEVTEGDPGDNTTITFTVTRSGDNGAESTVAYSVLPGTAGTPGDYGPPDPLTGTLTFAAGETEKTVTLDITEDDVPEETESFTVELSAPTNAAITKAIGTGTILDDDQPGLSINDPEVTEGDPGDNTTITFTVTRSGDNGAESTVAYSVLPGTAGTPGDYGPPDPLTGTLTFAAGETEKTVTLDITEDDIPEQTESFTVELSAPTNAAITKAIGTGTILDDDQPGLSINDPEVTEGDPGDNTTITFTVTRSGDNGAESTVAYSVLPGTAGTPGDYGPPDPLTGTLTFAAGETEKTITLDITEDDIPEQTESFTVELSAPTNAAITKAIGTGTILDDDQPGLSINDPEVTEGDPGDNTTITFTVTRSGDNGAESTVAYSVLPGTAGTPGDYGPPDPLTGTLTFAAGETEKTVTLDITEDDVPEETESFTVELSAPTNAAITKAIGTGTILDDDQPGLSINDPEVTEGDPGDNTTITFTVTRSGDNGAESTVAYSVLPGTAGTPGDYGPPDPLTGTLTFAAGETEKTVTLDITEDDIPEQTESFTVELSAPTNAAITKAIGTGTILDDDQPGLSINDPEVTEGDPGDNTTITFTVTRSGDNGAESTVAYSVLPGTAGTPGDYGPPDPLTGTLTFAAGETEKTVTLDITEDDIPEQTESFTVELSAPTNAAITKGIGTGTILDDDQPSLSDTVIWTSSDDSNALVGIGGSLNVGTDISAGTPTDHWTNSDGDRLWGTDANWEDGTKPILDDRVLFDEIDSGGTNFVSQNFTILSLYYTGAGSHITDVVNDSNLEITSSVGVGIDNPSSKGSLRIEDIEVTEVGGGINIGRKSLNTDTPVNGLLTLTIGSEFNAETSTGDVFIGFNGTNANSATGELNALESGATVNLDFDDLIVGHADGTGLAQGTLRWNQEEAIHANEVYFGLGSNATSVLDVPAGGTFRLGTDLDRAGFLNVAYNDTGAAGTLTAGLDFTVTNPTFEAYLDNTLTLGRKTIGATGDTDGTLTLGSNSTLDIQSVTGDVVIGFNQSNSDTVTGEFNALESGATVNLDIDNLFVGHAERTGTAQGTLRWNQEEAIHANGVWFGLGSNATSVLDVPAGGTFRLGTDLDRAGFLNVAYNDTGAAGTLTAGLDFTVTNPTFEAYLDNTLTLGRKTIGATGDTDGTLTLGSNSTLDILSGTGDVVIGFNQSNSDTVSGEFNALESGATVNLDFDDLIVGHAEGTGLAQGTLRWNQEEAIHANEVYFGRGSNATSVLDVPAGGTFRLGTDLDRAGFLNVAYNDTGAAGTLTAGLDFTVTNPTFEAYLDNTLTLGRKTIGATGDTDGTLTLGSNSTLDIQSVTGDVVIGFNQSNSDTVTGEFNALESGATVNLDIDNLFVGHAERTGTAQGTLRWNQEEAIHANGVWFGLGSNATSVLDVPAGGTFRLGTDLDRAGFLNVAYNDTGAAGTLTAGLDFTVTNPTFEAYLDNTLTLGRKTIGATGDTDGTLTLGSNSTLDILSGTGDVVIGFNQSNSDTVSGEFNALESGATVNLDFDDLIVGHAEGTGLAQGTLRWNQEEAIHANEVYFGRGSNATSVLDVPAGGTFRLGTDLDRAGFLNVAYNDTGAAGTLTAGLDFTVTNPTFEAYLDNTLTLGRKTIGATGDTDGTLTLGSNSTLDIQSVTGDVVIGFNQSNSDTVTGEFNALESGATVNLDIDNLFVGHAERTGTAQGTLRWNQEEAIHANGVWFGLGSNATSVLDVPAGGTLRLGTDIDRIGTLNVAYNDTSAAGTLTAGLDFTVTNPTFEAYLDNTLTLGRKTIGATGDTDGTLTLGSNSTLDILSGTGDVVIGFNQSNSDTVSGELNALESGATVNLDFDDLIVGHADGTGLAQGTLRWNQEEAIHANEVYFGLGSNATSVLDVPAGGTFRLGTDLDRAGFLNVAYNDTGAAGTLTAGLDFTVTNPTFEAYLDNTLTLGRKTIGAEGDTDGTLTLGSNSTLDIQSVTGDVVIGFNQSNSDTVTGEFNALESGATVNLDIDNLFVGHAERTGTAQGTLRWNQEEAIHANGVWFGLGSNATSVLDVPAGGTLRLGTDIDRIGTLNVAYNDTSAAGTLTAGLDFTVTNPTFEAYLDSTLTLGQKTIGATGDTDAVLTLGSNSTLDIQSNLGDVVIGLNQSNSDTVTGEFNALDSGATVNLDIDSLAVGHANGTGSAQGTLRWNQQEAIHANSVTFGRGSNAISVLDVPAGGTFRLGTDIDRIGTLNLAINDTAAAGTLSSALDFTVTNPTFEAYLDSTLTVGEKTNGATGDTDALLTLGSNSTLDIQSGTGDVILGVNRSNSDTVTGELNALESGATVNLDIDDLVVGHANSIGPAQGTLRWNQEEAIHANDVWFGRGSNAVSVLDVPAGGIFRLGTDIDRIGTLSLAYNDTAAAGTLSSALDFTVTNPTFEAYLDSTLTLGQKTIGATGDTDAVLTLGSNSTLDIQSNLGDVILGFNQSNSDTVTGEFNALDSGATVNLDIDSLAVGHANGTGSAQGTLRWNQQEAIHANSVTFGRGSNAISVLDVPAGGTFRLGTDIDRIGTLNLAINDTAAAGTLSSALDFTVTNPTFEAYLDSTLTLGQKTIGATGDTDAVLTLGSNSTLDIQSNLGDVILGFNQSNSDTVTGEFNALDSGATVNLDIDSLAVGHANGTGSAQGTLRWNQQEAIHANSVTFGRGSNAISVLDVPAGGTFRLGSDIDRIGTLNLAINDTSAAGSLTAELDFTVTNPTFEAYLDSTLTLGQKTIGATGDTDAVLTLGSNSTLDIQSNLGDVILGVNQSNSDTVTGELNATRGVFIADIDQLNIGLSSGSGAANGTFTIGDSASGNNQIDITANQVSIGSGSAATGTLTFLDNFTGNFNADSVNLSNGLFDFGNNTLTIDSGGNILVTTFNLTGGTLQGDTVDYDDTTGTFNFTGGTLSVDTFNGTLDQNGGTLAPGNTPGITTVNGNYSLDFPGTIEIELNGATTVGVDYDQLQVNGAVNLNADAGAGGTLDVVLGFTPTVGDSFTIIDNDANDLIVGFFDGLPQLGTFDVVNGADTVTFTINYAGGDDNDVVLEATAVNPTATATALAIDDTGTQGPMTLARSGPIVELVPDEDVLVFTNSTSDPLVADVKDPAAPPVFAMYVGLPATVGITKEEFSVDDTEQGIDPGLIDDLDLIGMPGESGLSHDLYV